MLFIAIFHVIFLLLAGTGLLKNKLSLIDTDNLYKFIVFIIIFLGSIIGILPEGPLTQLYLISAFIVPSYSRSIKTEDGFFIFAFLTFLLISVAFALPLEKVTFSTSAFLFSLSLLRKDLFSFLVGLGSFVYLGMVEVGLISANEIIAGVMISVIPLAYFIHAKGMNHLRFFLIPLLLAHTMLFTSVLSFIEPFLWVFLLIAFSFLRSGDKRNDLFMFIALYVVSISNLNALHLAAVFFIFFGSREILNLVFREFTQIEFRQGSLVIGYQNVLAILIALYCLTGTLYSPLSIIVGNMADYKSILFFIVWLIFGLKFIVSNKKENISHKNSIIEFLLFVSPVLVVFIDDNVLTVFNPWPLMGVFSTVLLTIVYKKRPELFNKLKDLEFKLRYRPIVKDDSFAFNNRSFGKREFDIKPLPSLDFKLSFPITIGLLFLALFVSILGFGVQ